MRTVFILVLFAMAISVSPQTTHVVQRGETFELIARRYGISVEELKSANSDDGICFTGLKIIVPPKKVAPPPKVVERPQPTASNNVSRRHATKQHTSAPVQSLTSPMDFFNPFNPFGIMSYGGGGIMPSVTFPFQFDFSNNSGPEFNFDFSNMPIAPEYQDIPAQSGGTVGGTFGSGATTGSSGSSETSGHKCRLCGGTGRKIRRLHPWDATQTKWCNECNKNVDTGHFHTNCDLCGGSGWIR